MATDPIVVIRDIDVMFVAGAPDRPIAEQAPAAFNELEAKLPTLRGRHFYGVVVGTEYRACVAIGPEDDPDALPHPRWVIPGGKYARRKLADWEEHRHLIGTLMAELRGRPDSDPSRPCIEYYRRKRELLLMVPVR
jgi:hypothetical protein